MKLKLRTEILAVLGIMLIFSVPLVANTEEVKVPFEAIKSSCYGEIDMSKAEFPLSEVGKECVQEDWLEANLSKEETKQVEEDRPTSGEKGGKIEKIWEKDTTLGAYSIAVTNSGWVGIIDVPSTQKSNRFIVFSRLGSVAEQWSPSKGSNFNICRAGDGYFALTCDDIFTILNAEGTKQLWRKSIDDFAKTSVSATDNGNRFFLANDPYGENSTVWSVDGRGNVLWSHKLDSRIGLTPIAVTDDGYAALTTEVYGSENGKNAVYLFNPSGELMWSKTFPATSNRDKLLIDVAVSSSAQSVLVGFDSGGMAKLNKDGNVEWKKEDIGSYLAMSEDGKYIAAASSSYIYLLDKKGNIRWKSSSKIWPHAPENIEISDDGKFIVSGSFFPRSVYILNGEGKELFYREGTESPRVNISENDNYIAVAVDGKAILFRTL